jgi:hypothetical protein
MRTGLSQPPAIDAILGQAATLCRSGRVAEAEKLYRDALALRPDIAGVHAGLALMLYLQGRPQEAIAAFREAVKIEPDNPDLLYKLGNMLLRDGIANDTRVEECFDYFNRHARLTFRPATAPGEAAHRIKHDREQQNYLARNFGLTQWQYHLADGGRIASAAVNPANSEGATHDWHRTHPQIIVVDDLLTPGALESLRRFCQASTIWHTSYDAGYLGAAPETGFACPLLAQIAEEFPRVLPDVLRAYPLKYLWAFKYDSTLSGINIHADFAAVNINFWITPDEANQDPDSGGLVVWDKAAPLDWDFIKYNTDDSAIRAFLKQAGAKPVTIPYRANRAVIFDSDLFHETDRLAFREGYPNRRINVTLLYGERDKHAPEKP